MLHPAVSAGQTSCLVRQRVRCQALPAHDGVHDAQNRYNLQPEDGGQTNEVWANQNMCKRGWVLVNRPCAATKGAVQKEMQALQGWAHGATAQRCPGCCQSTTQWNNIRRCFAHRGLVQVGSKAGALPRARGPSFTVQTRSKRSLVPGAGRQVSLVPVALGLGPAPAWESAANRDVPSSAAYRGFRARERGMACR